MFVASARFAHAGAAGEDDQVRLLQSAHHAVEIVQPGGNAGQLPVALESVRGHIDRGRERLREALEAAVVAAGLGQFVKPALGVLDLVARRKIDRRVERDIDHILADLNQCAADREIIDGVAVILGIDDGRRFGGEPGKILADCEAADIDARRRETF